MDDVCEGKDFSFPEQEERVLQLWAKLDAFHEQLRRTEGGEEFVFYDGPPFATGLPHYGHILAGTIKDVVTRHQSMRGRHVSRRFGWDCHGLPVEFEIDSSLGITNRQQVLDLGIGKYNEACRSIVTKYVSEWEAVVTRSGRWIDFKDGYKTMDLNFMESVWWVFAQLWEKDLIYKGFKVMPYSTGCKTALSNFEATKEHRTVHDLAVMVSFPIVGDVDNSALVAWTTTPWTLPSNLALCVNANLTYAKVKDKSNGAVYIIAESRLGQLPVKAKASGKKQTPSKGSNTEAVQDGLDKESYELLAKIPGSSLVGLKYTPLFDFFIELQETAFRVIADNYVMDDSGTGVVHCAPAFGEDDHRVCLASGIIETAGLVVAVDDDGCFIEKISDFKGQYVKEADKDIISAVKDKGRLVSKGSIEHSYPFCWRSGTPLIYRAVPSWFVKVEKIKDQLLECNKETYWVPDFVKEKRFHNWLEGARDWAVSRTRFWGTPLPLWMSQDGEEIVVMDSIEKLEKLSGVKVTDLHRHYVDDITIPSNRGPEFGVLKRVDDVFDCWFESGSMPYAYIHYPFENQELFEKNFPGNFVAEGLDQTRGWFYTLMVLSTALFGKPAFKNLICNGLVLAEDGKKMSKSKNNYPSPKGLIDKYGADSLRLYLINSPVVRAESLRFKSSGVYDVVKYVFLPWYNAYRFFVQNAKRLELEGLASFSPMEQAVLLNSANVLDHWINSATESLVSFVHQEMDAYRLYTVVPYLVKYIDSLTNIYVRLNRKRFKGRTGDEDCRVSLSTLYHVLVTTCVVMAPFTPFFTEVLYQNLRKVSSKSEESIHFCKFPSTTGERHDRVEQSVNRMVTIIDLAHNIRERHNKALKTPLREMMVVRPDKEFLEDITGKLEEAYIGEDNKRVKQKQREHNIVTFFVKVEGTSIPVREDLSTMTTKMLVDHALSVKGIRNCDCFAVYHGKVLCEDKLLSDYKVFSNCTIEVRVRGRAGMERLIHCTTFDDEMKDIDRISVIKLPKSLKNRVTQAEAATFLSEGCQYLAQQVLISLCRVHFRKKCFNGKFNSTQILFHEGRAVFAQSCKEETFTEEGCRKDYLVIAQLFRLYFFNDGSYPLYVSDLVQYLLSCPLGVNSNSAEAIALLVNHPALTSFVERMAQCSMLDSMVKRLTPDEMSDFVAAVGSEFSWGEVASNVTAMIEILHFRSKGKDADAEASEGKDANSEAGQEEENTYYSEDPRSCLTFARNYFRHAKRDLFLLKIEAAFSLNLENFLPLILRRIVKRFKGPSTFDIPKLLGDHVADRKRKKDSVGTENLEEMAAPAKKPKISFALNVKKNQRPRMGAPFGSQSGRS